VSCKIQSCNLISVSDKKEEFMAFKSKTKIFGLPLVCISGTEPAYGIIAIGQVAYGFFTIAQFGVGIIFGIGQFMAGFFTIAQFSVGLIMSVGQFSLGWYSIGMIAIGYHGIHGLGYHFLNGSYIDFIFKGWGAFKNTFIFFLQYTVLVYIVNLAYKLVFFTFNKDSHNKEEEEIKKSYKRRMIFLVCSMLVIWIFLDTYYGNRIYNECEYSVIREKGMPAIGTVLGLEDLNTSVDENSIYRIKVLVTPLEENITPYEAELNSVITEDEDIKIGDSIELRYRPEKLKDVAWLKDGL
jgi:hypothetical protein